MIFDPQGDLGEGGHNAVHGDLITHPGHGPNHCEGLDSPQSTSVGAYHFPSIWLVFIFLKYIFSHFWHDRGDLGEVGHHAGQGDLTGKPLPILQIFYSSFDF